VVEEEEEEDGQAFGRSPIKELSELFMVVEYVVFDARTRVRRCSRAQNFPPSKKPASFCLPNVTMTTAASGGHVAEAQVDLQLMSDAIRQESRTTLMQSDRGVAQQWQQDESSGLDRVDRDMQEDELPARSSASRGQNPGRTSTATSTSATASATASGVHFIPPMLAEKAGMSKVDKEMVAQITYEMSTVSPKPRSSRVIVQCVFWTDLSSRLGQMFSHYETLFRVACKNAVVRTGFQVL